MIIVLGPERGLRRRVMPEKKYQAAEAVENNRVAQELPWTKRKNQ